MIQGSKFWVVILIVTTLTGGSFSSKGQLMPYTQYQYSSALVNPAWTASDNNAEIAFIHRDQPFGAGQILKNSLVSIKYPLLNKGNRRWGGIQAAAFREGANTTDLLTQQGGMLTLAYNLPLTQRSYLAFGMQGNYTQRSVSWSGVSTGSQWIDNQGYDPTASLGEPLTILRSSYFAIGSGLLWYFVDEAGQQRHYLGASVYHLNQPVETLTGVPERVPFRYVLQGGYTLYRSSRISLTPDALYQHQSATHQVSVGGTLAYHFTDHNPFNVVKSGSISLTTRYRSEQTVATSIQWQQPNYTVGFGYDVGVGNGSKIVPATEFALSLRKSLFKLKTNTREKAVVSHYSLGEVREFYSRQTKESVADKMPLTTHPDTTASSKQPQGDFNFALKQDFHFSFNDNTLNEDARVYLATMASLLQENKDLQLRVIGHTDNLGSDAANIRISEARAKVVVDYLVKQGVHPDRLRYLGEGASSPLHPNDTQEHRAANRRVEFVIYRSKH